MRALYSWLREFCPVDLDVEELADRLTAQGVHVEQIERPWDRLQGVVVARVLEVRDHPDADNLCLARVDFGTGERELVVGVRNMGPGDLVPLAGPGATVPGLPEPLSERKIRGVTSQGMLCSPKELSISPDHEGILILPPDAPLGADFREHFGLDDAVLDIEIEPNRPDLMSVVGVAREASAATGTPFAVPAPDVDDGDEKAADVATVEIRDLERCPRYLARVVQGVGVGPSPVTVQARLFACGMRPLTNVVDATNYAMLELGQPLHPFDLALLDGAGIVVRRAEEGERIVTLDDVERTLSTEELVIADHAKAVAIAGVMGSAAAEVSPGTNDVLIESAYFDRRGILWTARRLGVFTEASLRFERGADPEAVPLAADRAAELMTKWSGGTVLAGSVEAGHAPPRWRLSVRPSRTWLLLGAEGQVSDVVEALERVGIRATAAEQDTVETEIPSHRVDLEREVDLIEEVARIRGYDRLPSTLPGIRQPGGLPDGYRLRRRIREALVRAGFRETRSLSFASQADLALTGDHEAVRVANPLRAEEAFLRTSLIPGLLRSLRGNVARQVTTAALFEIGTVFYPGEPVEEHERIAFALTGTASLSYPRDERELDLFDAKGGMEALMDSLGVTGWELGEPPTRRLFHPARSASILLDGELAGVVGEINPRTAASLDLPGRVAVAELEVPVLADHRTPTITYREVPRFPSVHRDLAFVVDTDVPAEKVRSALVDAAGSLADSVYLFDVFTGPPVPEGKKSLAFAVEFRAPDRTLTDEETDEAVARIVDRLARDFGAELRAG